MWSAMSRPQDYRGITKRRTNSHRKGLCMRFMRSSLAEQDIRDIFSRMQNLNLLCLIEDLRHDNVATRRWISPLSLYERHTSDASYKLCPLAHGWPCAAQHNSDV